MREYQRGDRFYLQSRLLAETGLVAHGFTSRLGGVSAGKVTGLNLGFRVGDDPEAVRRNYALVAADLGLDLNRMALAKQTHTDCIRVVTQADAGKGIARESDIEDTDGLMTQCRGIPLMVFSADCVPLLLLDPVRGAAAAIHAGWRGTVKGIGGKAVRLMGEAFGSRPGDILAAIGPSLGPCCFAFSQEEAGALFPKAYHAARREDKVYIDLWAMNRDQLAAQGVPLNQIEVAGVCTVCQADRYYSYRAHREHTGRQGAVIMLR